MSESDIESQDSNSSTRNMVSTNKYGKHRTTKSLDELTFNCILSTYEYAYVTTVRTETETDDLNKKLSVVTCDDSADCHITKNLDSPKNKINESNVINDNEDTFNFSSNNFSS